MQFAYQYPERCERLVLVGTGGIAARSTRVLRLASLPDADLVLCRAAAARHARSSWRGSIHLLSSSTPTSAATPPTCCASCDALPDATVAQRLHPHAARGGRLARPGRHHARPLLPHPGHAHAADVGRPRRVVPVRHAHGAHAAMPGSRLEIFEGAGPLPVPQRPRTLPRPRRGVHRHHQPRRLEPRTLERLSCAPVARAPPRAAGHRPQPRGRAGLEGGERTQRDVTAARAAPRGGPRHALAPPPTAPVRRGPTASRSLSDSGGSARGASGAPEHRDDDLGLTAP